jgi:ATP-dependent exoDNAse (exonuclease V) beta subunit
MARISTLEDLDPVLKDLQNNGTVQPEQVPDLKSEIQKVISRPEINKYFQKGVKAYNEKDILLNDSTVLRPDRVVIDGNKVIVIDYKTGKKDAKHKQQMTEYIEALRQMGYLHSEYHLVYLNP